jgi:ABC-type molybdenum transport system ATPase subunit/photorepair protein PhrA
VDNVSDAEALEGKEWLPWSGTCAGREPGGLSRDVAKEDQNRALIARSMVEGTNVQLLEDGLYGLLAREEARAIEYLLTLEANN